METLARRIRHKLYIRNHVEGVSDPREQRTITADVVREGARTFLGSESTAPDVDVQPVSELRLLPFPSTPGFWMPAHGERGEVHEEDGDDLQPSRPQWRPPPWMLPSDPSASSVAQTPVTPPTPETLAPPPTPAPALVSAPTQIQPPQPTGVPIGLQDYPRAESEGCALM